MSRKDDSSAHSLPPPLKVPMESRTDRPDSAPDLLMDTTPALRRLTAPQPSDPEPEPVARDSSHRYQLIGAASSAATFGLTAVIHQLGYVQTFRWAPAAILGLLLGLYAIGLTGGRREAITGMRVLLLVLAFKGVLAFVVGFAEDVPVAPHWLQLGYLAIALATWRALRTPAARDFFGQG